MRRIILVTTVALLMTTMVALLGAGTVAAHPHVAEKSPHGQEIANGQNHPAFTYDAATNLSTSCDTSANGYGLNPAAGKRGGPSGQQGRH